MSKIKNGQGKYWFDPGDEYGYEMDTCFLEICFNDGCISFEETIQNETKKNFAPSDYSDEYVNALTYHDGKECNWIINNLIDLIKNKQSVYDYEEEREDGLYTTVIENYGDYIVIRMEYERGLSQYYINAELHIQKEAFKNLKDILFDIKKKHNI